MRAPEARYSRGISQNYAFLQFCFQQIYHQIPRNLDPEDVLNQLSDFVTQNPSIFYPSWKKRKDATLLTFCSGVGKHLTLQPLSRRCLASSCFRTWACLVKLGPISLCEPNCDVLLEPKEQTDGSRTLICTYTWKSAMRITHSVLLIAHYALRTHGNVP
ncbi:hypothetical protein PoB_006800500 [Plakobranchus ocellatus]|uniref:Uncharacterized protein n=1 Tax=Plakobranchus ocellatus TaxID=259542 RepID=A0AAV4DBM7_9GAST|nr:hypothetical protein PoB_006800500 [Plakobranchus ocellatus]